MKIKEILMGEGTKEPTASQKYRKDIEAVNVKHNTAIKQAAEKAHKIIKKHEPNKLDSEVSKIYWGHGKRSQHTSDPQNQPHHNHPEVQAAQKEFRDAHKALHASWDKETAEVKSKHGRT